MKKTSILIAALTLVPLSNGLALDGLRLGMSFGARSYIAQTETTDQHVKSAPSVGIILGYDHLIADTPIFIGYEAAANNHNAESIMDGKLWPAAVSYSLRLKTNNTISNSFRFGVESSETRLYAKVGLSITNWQTLVKAQSKDHATNFKKIGYLGGLGIETKLNENVSLGVEHEYMISNDIKNIRPSMFLKLSPSANTTSFRLIYKF